MIIECKSCSKKFFVKDSDIPIDGRTVQCGSCLEQWLQMPVSAPVAAVKSTVDENLYTNELRASDGKMYKFLGMQWAEILPSGKTGMLAQRRIATELNSMVGKKVPKTVQKIEKKRKYEQKKEIDPSSEQIDSKKPKQGLGFFGYTFLLILIAIIIVGVLKTFERELLIYLPASEYIFELLDKEYFFEPLDNLIRIVKDLIKSY